jgi:hypothetical protein
MAEKKKAGRPRKVKAEPTVDTVVEHWKNVVSSKDEIIEDLEQMLDNSYKNQEEMLAELDRFVQVAEEGFKGIEEATDGINYNDVMYHITFFRRVMHKRFSTK